MADNKVLVRSFDTKRPQWKMDGIWKRPQMSIMPKVEHTLLRRLLLPPPAAILLLLTVMLQMQHDMMSGVNATRFMNFMAFFIDYWLRLQLFSSDRWFDFFTMLLFDYWSRFSWLISQKCHSCTSRQWPHTKSVRLRRENGIISYAAATAMPLAAIAPLRSAIWSAISLLACQHGVYIASHMALPQKRSEGKMFINFSRYHLLPKWLPPKTYTTPRSKYRSEQTVLKPTHFSCISIYQQPRQ